MCPSEESIAAWLDERKPAGVERHLAACDECRMLVSELSRTRPVGRRTSAKLPCTTLSPGARVGRRYRIVRFIAKGGMGELYEADDLELGERVALKTARLELGDDPGVLECLRKETQLARRVTHANVCRIHDLVRTKRALFVTMELLVGETLREHIARRGRMSTDEAIPYIRQMAEALCATHAAGIIHRDFKSANVILADRGAVLSDFGLAMRSGDPHETSGSPVYMAPEQLSGGEITTAVDVYALGIVLYEMMTGSWPFVSDTPMQTALKRLQEEAPSPRLHVADLDPIWERVILRCLERDPRERFASPLDVVNALQRGLERRSSV